MKEMSDFSKPFPEVKQQPGSVRMKPEGRQERTCRETLIIKPIRQNRDQSIRSCQGPVMFGCHYDEQHRKPGGVTFLGLVLALVVQICTGTKIHRSAHTIKCAHMYTEAHICLYICILRVLLTYNMTLVLLKSTSD